MPVTYTHDGDALTVGSTVWADSFPIVDASAIDLQNSGVCAKEQTIKELQLQAYGGVYDAAGSQALSSTPAALEGGANWDGSFGPTAYNTTLTATTLDGITPTVAGIYEVNFSLNWITAAAHTLTVAVYAGASIAATGAQVRSMSVTETASQYQSVSGRFLLALAADVEIRLFVASATGTPTLTYRDAVLWIKRVAPSA